MSKKEGKKVPMVDTLWKDMMAGRKRYVPLQAEDEENVAGKIVVISGAVDSGIGEVATIEFVKRDAIVIMCCEDVEKGKTVMDSIKEKVPKANLDLLSLNLGNLESVRKCAENIKAKYSQIHILINNDAAFLVGEELIKTVDGFEVHMGTNYLANFLFTILLLDLVKGNATTSSKHRIVFVGATAHLYAELDLTDLMLEKRGKSFGIGNLGPYANSKLATMYFARELVQRLDGSNVLVSVLCPGFLKTDVFRNATWLDKLKINFNFFLSGSTSRQGADVILYCSLSTRLSNSSKNGEMYRFNEVWPGVMEALDDIVAKELWDMSEKLVGLK